MGFGATGNREEERRGEEGDGWGSRRVYGVRGGVRSKLEQGVSICLHNVGGGGGGGMDGRADDALLQWGDGAHE